MSKRILAPLSLLLAACFTFQSVLVHSSTSADAPPVAIQRTGSTTSATAEILKETSKIRELAVLRPVPSGAQSRVQIEQMLVKKLDEQLSKSESDAAELTLKKFGLAPADFKYRQFIIKLLTEQVAGYYDPRARRFNLADWLELDGQKPIIAHELTHALQDQHFNLRRFENWPKHDSDAELAAHALIEGDATLTMTHYIAQNPMVALAFGRAMLSNNLASEQYNQAPRSLRETLIFPYLEGVQWAAAVHKRGGWALLSKAFHHLPQSSEQILHPEKYFSNEQPVKVTLPDISRDLNLGSRRQSAIRNSQPAIGPWRRVDYDVNGEWGLYLILDQYLKSADVSKKAAAGWSGDRYAVYQNSVSGQVLLMQESVWDSEADAREFFDAYVKRTALRYPDAKERTVPYQPCSVGKEFETSEGVVVLELVDKRVMVFEGLPQKFTRPSAEVPTTYRSASCQ